MNFFQTRGVTKDYTHKISAPPAKNFALLRPVGRGAT